MARTYDLLVRARGDSRDAQKAMRQLQRSVRNTARDMKSIGRTMTMGLTLPVLAFGKLAYDELTTAAVANAQTGAALKSTGGAAHVTMRHIQALSQAILNKSGIDDQAVQSGANMLLTFTNIRNEAGKSNKIFDAATQAVADMSTAMQGGAIPSAEQMRKTSIQVGKALNDPIKGITALKRVGVTFTDQQKDQIKALMKSGKRLDAQKLILKELNKEFGGSATAAGKTLPGQLSKLKESVAGAGASILRNFMPAIHGIIDKIQIAANWFSKLSPGVKKIVGEIAIFGAIAGPVILVLGSIAEAVATLLPALVALTGPIGLVAAGVIAAGGAIVYLYKTNEHFRDEAKKIWSEIYQTIRGTLQELQDAIRTWSHLAVKIWKAIGPTITKFVLKHFGDLKNIFMTNFRVLSNIFRFALNILSGHWGKAWQNIKNIVHAYGAQIKAYVRILWDALSSIFMAGARLLGKAAAAGLGFVAGLFQSFGGKVEHYALEAWDNIKRGFVDAINWIIKQWNGLKFSVPKVSVPHIGSFGGGHIGVPTIPLIGGGSKSGRSLESSKSMHASKGVHITQNMYFQGQPDMFAAAHMARFQFQTAGLLVN